MFIRDLHLLFGRGAAVCCRATLKSGIRNRKETEHQNPESTNKKKQVLQRQSTWKITVRTFASKNERISKKVLKQKIAVC